MSDALILLVGRMLRLSAFASLQPKYPSPQTPLLRAGFPLYISEAARRDLAIDFAEWAVFAIGGDAVVRCAAIQPYGGTREIFVKQQTLAFDEQELMAAIVIKADRLLLEGPGKVLKNPPNDQSDHQAENRMEWRNSDHLRTNVKELNGR
ncbi:hypothetical protein Q9233_008533 [Columba guinea]|nr:hypothetical protein Q9233_008533 [Columba guinea]